MKIPTLVLLLAILLTSCLPPAPTANPGEVIYEYVPGKADEILRASGITPMPPQMFLATSLITYFGSQRSVTTGYSNLKFQNSKEISPGNRELVFLAQKTEGSEQIQSVWRVVDRGGNYVGVFANTTTTDTNVNIATIEKTTFAFIDGLFKRISSAR